MTTNVTITLEGSASEIASQQKALQRFAQLPGEDRGRISQLILNNKALAALKSKWLMLKMMF